MKTPKRQRPGWSAKGNKINIHNRGGITLRGNPCKIPPLLVAILTEDPMNFFKKRTQENPKPTSVSAGLPRAGDALPASLKAHSQFIKRAHCSQCGAPKSLPSTTAYIYCDYCGSLMDYDFRAANADTNAGLTNTVFHRIIATVQIPLAQAKERGDREVYRQIYRQV